MCRKLIDAGAKPDILDIYNRTPFLSALEKMYRLAQLVILLEGLF